MWDFLEAGGDSLGDMDLGLDFSGYGPYDYDTSIDALGGLDYGSMGDAGYNVGEGMGGWDSVDRWDPANGYVPTTGYSPTLGDLASTGLGMAGNYLMKNNGANALKVASGLYDMYSKNKIAKQLAQPLQVLNNQYAPGSPEANAMRQAIERRDAAGGRRSQYGTRETELAGQLAQQRSNVLNSPGYLNMNAAYASAKHGGLNSLFRLGGDILSDGKNFANGGQVRNRNIYREIPPIPDPMTQPNEMQRRVMEVMHPRVAGGVSAGGDNQAGPDGSFGSLGTFGGLAASTAMGALGLGPGPGPMGIANAISIGTTGQTLGANLGDVIGNTLGEMGIGTFGNTGTTIGNAVANADALNDGFFGDMSNADPADAAANQGLGGFGGEGAIGGSVGNVGGVNGSAGEGMGGSGTGEGGVARNGGKIMRTANGGSRAVVGGKIPGHDLQGEDDVPINVSGGEYVIPTDVVDAVGHEFFDTLNKLFHKPIRRN